MNGFTDNHADNTNWLRFSLEENRMLATQNPFSTSIKINFRTRFHIDELMTLKCTFLSLILTRV